MSLKISITSVLSVEELQLLADVHGYREQIPNPEFNNLKVESDENPKLIANPKSRTQFALNYIAEKFGNMIVSEFAFLKRKNLTPAQLDQLKLDVFNELKQNFEMDVTPL